MPVTVEDGQHSKTRLRKTTRDLYDSRYNDSNPNEIFPLTTELTSDASLNVLYLETSYSAIPSPLGLSNNASFSLYVANAIRHGFHARHVASIRFPMRMRISDELHPLST